MGTPAMFDVRDAQSFDVFDLDLTVVEVRPLALSYFRIWTNACARTLAHELSYA